MKKILFSLMAIIFAVSCSSNKVQVTYNALVVKSIETNNPYGVKYLITTKAPNALKDDEIAILTDSLYKPGDTIYLSRKP